MNIPILPFVCIISGVIYIEFFSIVRNALIDAQSKFISGCIFFIILLDFNVSVTFLNSPYFVSVSINFLFSSVIYAEPFIEILLHPANKNIYKLSLLFKH